METTNNTILIIEDDLGLNELISEKIKELGFQTYSVFTVDEAINWLSEFIPYLMVVDYSLSNSTAKDFIYSIKAKGITLPPFIVSTGQGDERIAVEMMKLGARDYIIKDTNLLELLPNIISRVAKEIDNENKLKHAENELKESEEILLRSQKVAQLGSYTWDIINGYWTSSAILDNIFGIDENYNRTTQGWLDLIHPDWQDIMSDYITNDIVLKHHRFDKEYKIIRKDNGQECWVHGLGDLEFDSSNNPIKLFGTISNINQRKMAEIALKESEEKYRILFEANKDGITIFNAYQDGKVSNFLEMNESAAAMLGYTKAELSTMNPSDIEIDVSDEKMGTRLNELKTNGFSNFETVLKHKNNSKVQVEIIVQVIKYNNLPALMNITRDITERKKIEDAIKFLITCGNTTRGEDFFKSLAKYLSKILEMEYVCIDKLDGDGLTAHTLAIYNDGVYDSNVSYTLKETPCGDVVGKTICCFPENVCNLFPNDRALSDLNAESYVGTTLWSFDNKPIGLIAIIGRKPLKNKVLVENILRMVSVRASGELERKKTEEALHKKMDQLSLMNGLMVNREVRMVEMKKEINELLESIGREKRY